MCPAIPNAVKAAIAETPIQGTQKIPSVRPMEEGDVCAMPLAARSPTTSSNDVGGHLGTQDYELRFGPPMRCRSMQGWLYVAVLVSTHADGRRVGTPGQTAAWLGAHEGMK